jgi:hypothetical protein
MIKSSVSQMQGGNPKTVPDGGPLDPLGETNKIS